MPYDCVVLSQSGFIFPTALLVGKLSTNSVSLPHTQSAFVSSCPVWHSFSFHLLFSLYLPVQLAPDGKFKVSILCQIQNSKQKPFLFFTNFKKQIYPTLPNRSLWEYLVFLLEWSATDCICQPMFSGCLCDSMAYILTRRKKYFCSPFNSQTILK